MTGVIILIILSDFVVVISFFFLIVATVISHMATANAFYMIDHAVDWSFNPNPQNGRKNGKKKKKAKKKKPIVLKFLDSEFLLWHLV